MAIAALRQAVLKYTNINAWSRSPRLVVVSGASSNRIASFSLNSGVVFFSMGGDETAWVWVDPRLDVVPTLASANASGTIKSFEADFVQLQLQTPGLGGLDELRTGTSFADVAPFTAIPEPGPAALLCFGAAGLAFAGRRPSAPCARPRAPAEAPPSRRPRARSVEGEVILVQHPGEGPTS